MLAPSAAASSRPPSLVVPDAGEPSGWTYTVLCSTQPVKNIVSVREAMQPNIAADPKSFFISSRVAARAVVASFLKPKEQLERQTV